jgi:molybdopterin converting factor subunit 1
MRVELLYFGVLKEGMGMGGETVELADGVGVGELLRVLRGRTSNQSIEDRVWESLAVAVNREYAAASVVLREGDEVALLPPVSGGCFGHGMSATVVESKDYAD